MSRRERDRAGNAAGPIARVRRSAIVGVLLDRRVDGR